MTEQFPSLILDIFLLLFSMVHNIRGEKKRRDLNKLVSISWELSCYLLCKLFLLFFLLIVIIPIFWSMKTKTQVEQLFSLSFFFIPPHPFYHFYEIEKKGRSLCKWIDFSDSFFSVLFFFCLLSFYMLVKWFQKRFDSLPWVELSLMLNVDSMLLFDEFTFFSLSLLHTLPLTCWGISFHIRIYFHFPKTEHNNFFFHHSLEWVFFFYLN